MLAPSSPRNELTNGTERIGIGRNAGIRKPKPVLKPVKARYIRKPRKHDQMPPRARRCLMVERNPLVIG